jgi:hypothetical protein
MSREPLTVGSTYRFFTDPPIEKDGAVWDLTSAVVTLLLKKPDGTVLTKAATVVAPATAGVAEYVSVASDLDIAGNWSRSWKVTDGTVTQISHPKRFTVEAAP